MPLTHPSSIVPTVDRASVVYGGILICEPNFFVACLKWRVPYLSLQIGCGRRVGRRELISQTGHIQCTYNVDPQNSNPMQNTLRLPIMRVVCSSPLKRITRVYHPTVQHLISCQSLQAPGKGMRSCVRGGVSLFAALLPHYRNLQ